MTSTRILLAIDDRPTSRAAIRWTADRARRLGAAVEVVCVATDDDVLLATARSAVASAVAEIRRCAPDTPVTTTVPRGNVLDVLVELSEHADLLVVGSDRPSPVRALLHAGLPMRLAGLAQCTLVVVPSTWSLEAGSRIAVGWDDELEAATALEAAAGEAAAAGLPLHIHRVWRPGPVARYDPAGGDALVEAIEESERLALDRVVRETSARHPGLAVIGELHLGSGAAGILGYAADSALIVVGSHRRSAIGEIVAGASGDELIALSTRIPIMVTAPGSAGTDDHQDDDDDEDREV